MRRVWFLFFLLVLLAGCKTVELSRQYRDACLADADCAASMAKVGNTTKVVVSAGIGTVVPGLSVAEAVGGVIGSMASFVTGVFLGRKRCK